MKKVVSLIIACSLLVSTISVQAVSFNVSDESLESTDNSLESTPTPTTPIQEDESAGVTPPPLPPPVSQGDIEKDDNNLQSNTNNIITNIPSTNQVGTYSSIIDDGYCGAEGDGTNLTWTLYSDGELEIRGTGAMKDYTINNTPWYSRRNSITKLTLSEGITHIGNYAFMTVLVYRGYCNI